MQHIRRTIAVIIIANIIVLGVTFIVGQAEDYASQPVPKVQHEVDVNSGMDQNLLPPGCQTVTPGGEALATNCLFGFVWSGGRVVDGADVTVIGANGKKRTVQTKEDSLGLNRYGLALSGAPLDAKAGQSIRIKAEYADRVHTVDYVVRPGTQRVDIALLSASTSDDYIYNKQLWYAAEASRLRGPHGIALDSNGDLYVVDRENQRIQVFDLGGTFLRGWGMLGNGRAEFFSPFGIAIDNTDYVYVTDTGNHRILKFNKLGTQVSEIGSFGAELGQFYSPEGVAIDSRGYIYVADSANHRIQKFRSDGSQDERFGNGGAVGSLGGGGGVGNVKFRYPTAMALDSKDNLYVTDYQNDRVQKFDSNGNFLLAFGTFGHCIGADGCQNGDMRLPDGIAIDDEDNIYVSDTNHRIQKFDSQGNWLAKEGQPGTGNAQFEYPKGLAVNSSGDIYIADEFNHRIQKISSTFAFLGAWGNSAGNDKQLSSPQGTAVDDDGNLYVADNDENRIQKFDKAGVWVKNIGQLNGPQDVAVDSQGNLYVADTENNRIQKMDRDGNSLGIAWGSLGNEDGQFKQPFALALDEDDNVYVADKFNHRIQKFSADGTHVATWGGVIGSGDLGKFNAPTDIVVDAAGHVYVADGSNHRIQKLDNTGQHLATIGEFGALDSQFDTVTGVDIDDEGNIYAVDETGRIQKFDPDGKHLATWGAAPVRGEDSDDAAPRFNQLDKKLRITVAESDAVYISDTRNNRVQTYVQGGSGKPIAFINWIENRTIGEGEILKIRGMGQDSDLSNNIVAFEWKSSKDGVLNAGRVTSANINQSKVSDLIKPIGELTNGAHSITLRVQDDEGEWSDLDSVLVFVSRPVKPKVAWTFLLYLAADYADNQQLFTTFTEKITQLHQNLDNPNIRVVIQLDGPGSDDTYRFKLEPNASGELSDIAMNELEMDKKETLVDFIRWGQTEFPAQNYYLTIANHGQAIQGIAWDKTSDEQNNVSNLSSKLTVKEIGAALTDENIAPISILHLDACSMNLLETAYEVREKIEFLISSQWMGWDYFAYDAYIRELDTDDAPGVIAEKIAQRYATLAEADDYPYTISVLDMERSEVALNSIDILALELAAYLQANPDKVETIRDVREKVQTFESDSDFQNTPLDMYVDLVSWAQKLQANRDLSPAMRQRAFNVAEELVGQMIRTSHAQSKELPEHIQGGAYINNDDANGLSIFYPVNQHSIVFQKYAGDELFNFTGESLTKSWLGFLRVATDPLPDDQQPEVPPPPLPPIGGNSRSQTVTPTPTPTFSSQSDTQTSTVMPTPTALPTLMPTATSTATSTATPRVDATSTPTISVTRVPGSDEPNDSCNQAYLISPDGLTSDYTFHSENDEDWYRLDVTAGVEYRIDIDVPNDSPADVEPELHPNCDSLPENRDWGQSFSPGARLSYSGNKDGSIYLRLQKPDRGPFGDDVKYQLTVRVPSSAPASRAAILIAGEFKREDPLQRNIHHVTDQAFQLFQRQGYSSDDIYYLINDENVKNRDADATTKNVRLAITEWAMDELESDGVLNLYIIDHGNVDRVYLDAPNNEILKPDDLDAWLTELEEAKPNLKVNVFIEACYAGSFIEGELNISKNGRVVITSSDADWLAYASNQGAYFSDHLLTSLWQGRNLFSSFLEASNTVQGLYPRQKPLLDANGNSKPNEPEDFAIASNRGYSYAGTFDDTANDSVWAPFIVNTIGPTNIVNGQGIITAIVRDDVRVNDVWAVIYPPSYVPLDTRQDELVQETLQTLKLTAIDSEQYGVDYRAFNEKGTYRVVLHAEDNLGMVARPVEFKVEVEGLSNTVYLPMIKR